MSAREIVDAEYPSSAARSVIRGGVVRRAGDVALLVAFVVPLVAFRAGAAVDFVGPLAVFAAADFVLLPAGAAVFRAGVAVGFAVFRDARPEEPIDAPHPRKTFV